MILLIITLTMAFPKTNDHISNLRLATASENGANAKNKKALHLNIKVLAGIRKKSGMHGFVYTVTPSWSLK